MDTGRIIDVNPCLMEILGLERDQIIGKDLNEIGLFEDGEQSGDALGRLRTRGYVRYPNLPLPERGGRRTEVEFVASVYDTDDRPIAQCNVRDITDRVEMQEQISRQTALLADESRRKDQFLAMLSHELRNPLAPIRSATALLRLHEAPDTLPAQRKAREIIERQVGSLTKMVDDLLEVSRVLTGRIRLETAAIDLGQVVNHAAQTVLPIMEQRLHRLVVTGVGSDPLWVNGDAIRLEEVFVNLLNNAAKYTDRGGLIEISCEQKDGQAVVRVRDNGTGIDPELLPSIFDLFSQADRSLDHSAGGLGIGLSLARRLVELHGGTIEAHSRGPGQGSEFIVRLAIGLPPVEGADRPPAVEPEGLGQSRGRILVVDDNVDACLSLSQLLQAKGYTVHSAHTGPEAVEAARGWPPELILLDIGLPGMDGYQVARRLRAEPSLAGVQLVAVTGYGSENDLRRTQDAGFDGHLLKPINADDVQRLFSPRAPGTAPPTR